MLAPRRPSIWFGLSSLVCCTGADGDPVTIAHQRSRGQELFVRHCAHCHGPKGDGHGLRRANFTQAPTDFTNPAWRASPKQVRRVIRQGKPGTAMPAWQWLEQPDVDALATYVLSLRGTP